MGPAFPLILTSPPPATLAVSEKGMTEAGEKSCSSMFTFSSAIGLNLLLAWPSDTRPPEIFTCLTERSSLPPVGADAADGGLDTLAPSLEKFQTPAAFCQRAICGPSIVISVTLSLRSEINGQSSTPILIDFALTKGAWLKAGSSAMERSAAATPPDKMESF